MRAGVFLLVAAVALSGCTPMTEVGANAPPVAAPQQLLPEEYSAPPAEVAATAAPPRPVSSPAPLYPVAPAREGQGVTFSGMMFDPYHPHWTVNVQ